MTLRFWNLLLAAIWIAGTGRLTAINLAIGFILGFLALRFDRRAPGTVLRIRKIRQIVGFAIFFLRELIASGLRVARHVLQPTHRMRPGVIGVPLAARTDEEITLLANLVSLTPGSLSLDVSSDRSTLYVHVMSIASPEATRSAIKDGFERYLLEVLR